MILKKPAVQKLVSNYPIGRLIGYWKIKKGFQNYTYIISTDKGKYILRIGKKTKKESDILFEINFLRNIKNIPIPKYILGINNKYVNKFKGHNYVVYKYIEGKTPKRISSGLLREVAYFLAKFHTQSEKLPSFISIKRFAWYDLPDKKIKKITVHLLRNLSGYKDEILYLNDELLKNKLSGKLPKGTIHCDVKSENLLVDSNKLSGVIDFDNCQIGPYVLDIGISIIWFCTDKKGLNFKKAENFIKYYEKYRTLNSFEKANIILAIKYAYLSHEFIDYYIYSKGIITKKYFDFGRKYFLNAVKKM